MATVGSFINLIADRSLANVAPQVGMGATYVSWSDRRACTVVKVSPSSHKITVQYDNVTRTDRNGMSDCQSYRFERNTTGGLIDATRRRDGSYRVAGGTQRILIGVRDEYHDYSF